VGDDECSGVDGSQLSDDFSHFSSFKGDIDQIFFGSKETKGTVLASGKTQLKLRFTNRPTPPTEGLERKGQDYRGYNIPKETITDEL